MIKLTLPDGTVRQLPVNSTGLQLADSIGKKLARDALAIEVDGKVQSLLLPIKNDAKVRILTWEDETGKDAYRHSTAHVFAHALKRLYPMVKLAIGPAVRDGFYYDVDNVELTPEDFPKIESEMQKIINANYEFRKLSWTMDDVKKRFKNNPYKLEMARELADKNIPLTAYKSGDFVDLCEGPHVPSTKYIKAFKLTKIASAYWRGDEKNKQLLRVYGTSFPSTKQLQEYLDLQEELKKRDHRRLGKQLDLFTFSELVGSGLPMYTPKGTVLWRELTGFSEELQKKAGFQSVWIPHITKTELYKKSGHWDKFGDELFLVKSQETSDEFVMKPMNCPHHTQIYASKKRSYRDLPIRYMETTTCYRDEKSGELSGLSRVRSLTQDDGHVFCKMDQIEQEFEAIMKMIKEMYSTLKLDFKCRLSFWNPEEPDKYLGSAADWEHSQEILERIAKKLDIDYHIEMGEAAFYGPKIDIMVVDAFGREWQCATEQLDFNIPARFGLKYTDADGREKTPVMIHKALLGSVDRFLSVYIEHTGGNFPLWLSPEQVRVLPVADRFNGEAQKLVDLLKSHDVRAALDDSHESISKKVRNAQLEKVNYILVFGEREMKGDLNVRTREGKVSTFKTDKFISQLLEEIAGRK